MSDDDTCQAAEWVQQWGHDAHCCLPRQHAGLHWDDLGWEW